MVYKMNFDIKGGLFALGLGLLLAGYLLISGFMFNAEMAALRNNGIATTAVVVSIEDPNDSTIGPGRRSAPSIIMVTYTADDALYTTRLRIGSRYANIGQEVPILFDPNTPSQITAQDRTLSNYPHNGAVYVFVIPVSVGFVIYGIVLLRKGIKRKHSDASK